MALFNVVFTPTDSDTQTKTNTEFLRVTAYVSGMVPNWC